MKRRTFIYTALAGSAAVGIPWYYYNSQTQTLADGIPSPLVLTQICEEKDLLEIGNAYRANVSAEDSRRTLAKLITDGYMPGTTSLENFIQEKIQFEFSQNKTVVASGWVLSPTEARQCALYSLSQS